MFMAELALVLGSVCGVTVSLVAVGLGVLLRRRFCPASPLTSGSEEDGSTHRLPSALGAPAGPVRQAPSAWEDGREASDSFLSEDAPPPRTLSLPRRVLSSADSVAAGAPPSPLRRPSQPTALALLIAANHRGLESAGEAYSSRGSSRCNSRACSRQASPRLQPAPMPALADAAPSLAC